MAKIFISHSSDDKELVDAFALFLRVSFNRGEKDVFYTSRDGGLPSGTKFIEAIKTEIENCIAVVFIISENFMRSPFCLTELGAAWALNQNIHPFLVPPVNHRTIDRTPLIDTICHSILDENALRKFGDDLNDNGICFNSLSDFEKNLKVFLTSAEKFVTKEKKIVL